MIIYTSLPVTPDHTWFDDLSKHHTMQADNTFAFDSYHRLREQRRLTAALPQHNACTAASENIKALRISPSLLRNPVETGTFLGDLDESDDPEASIARNMFVLIRSQLLVADLNAPSEKIAQEMLMAHMLHLPIIGLSRSSTISPWSYRLCSCVINPKSIDDVILEIRAHI